MWTNARFAGGGPQPTLFSVFPHTHTQAHTHRHTHIQTINYYLGFGESNVSRHGRREIVRGTTILTPKCVCVCWGQRGERETAVSKLLTTC